jgi:type I restriction enzyme S subunit
VNDRGQKAGPEDLPEGWSYATLEQVCDPVLAVDPRKHFEAEFKYIDISSIDAEKLSIFAAKNISKNEKAPSRARQLVKSGDTLLSTVRVYLRNIAMVHGDYDGQIASTGFCVLRGSTALEHRFLFHFVTGRSFTNALLPLQRGNSPPAVLEEDVKAQRIPVPPINEQRRIVEKIDELFSDIEQGEAALSRAKALLQRYRQAVLNSAVTGELTRDWRGQHTGEIETGEQLLARILETRRAAWEQAELAKMAAKGQRPKDDSWKRRYKEPIPPDIDRRDLPAAWTRTTIASIALLVTDGDHNPPKRVPVGVPHLTAKNVTGWTFDMRGCSFVSPEGFAQTKARYHPKAGDVIITCVGRLEERQSCRASSSLAQIEI